MPIRKNLVRQRKQIAKRNNLMTQKRRSFTYNTSHRIESISQKIYSTSQKQIL